MFRPNIGIDIDGVIGDSDKTFRKYLNKEFGFNLKRSDITKFMYEDILDVPKSKIKKFWENFTEKKLWLEIPLLQNAKSSIDYLKDKYNVIIITARPEKLKDMTVEWLEKNQIQYDDLIFIDEQNKESKISKIFQKNINLRFHIEDRAEYAVEFAKAEIKVILFDYPWNKNIKGKFDKEYLIRVKNWREALSYV